MTLRRALLAVMILAVAGAGCGSDEPVPTAPSPFAGTSTEVYADTISIGGSSFYAFSVFTTLTVRVTFGSLTLKSSGATLSGAMTIGLGIPSGTGCGLFKGGPMSTALSAQITAELAPGIYCVSISDPGTLTGDTNFAIRITQGTLNLASTSSPATFASNLAKNGNSVRTFAAGAGGTVTVSLDSVTPSTVIGFGVGIWQPVTSTCSLFQVQNASGGVQVTAPADQGIYCVRIFDVGNVADFVAFSVSIRNP